MLDTREFNTTQLRLKARAHTSTHPSMLLRTLLRTLGQLCGNRMESSREFLLFDRVASFNPFQLFLSFSLVPFQDVKCTVDHDRRMHF